MIIYLGHTWIQRTINYSLTTALEYWITVSYNIRISYNIKLYKCRPDKKLNSARLPHDVRVMTTTWRGLGRSVVAAEYSYRYTRTLSYGYIICVHIIPGIRSECTHIYIIYKYIPTYLDGRGCMRSAKLLRYQARRLVFITITYILLSIGTYSRVRVSSQPSWVYNII